MCCCASQMWLSSCWAAVPLCRSPTPPLLALLLTAALVVALRLHAQPAGVQQTAALEASLAELPAGAMRRWFLNTTDPLAVCNDGTSGAATSTDPAPHALSPPLSTLLEVYHSSACGRTYATLLVVRSCNRLLSPHSQL